MQIIKVPKNYLCALTNRIMEVPVKAVDGYTYDYCAITDWYVAHDTSPKSGERITDFRLRQDSTLKNEILVFLSNCKPNVCTLKDFFKFMTHDCSVINEKYLDIYLYERNIRGHTPLHIAANYNQELLISEIAEQLGPEHFKKLLDTVDLNGLTPLHYACQKGRHTIVTYLIQKGASLTTPDNNGNTPLHTAAIYGNVNLINLLIEKNASQQTTNNSGDTPLMSGIRAGCKYTAAALINESTNYQIRDNEGKTLLHLAINSDIKKIAIELIKKIDINCIDDNGDTPLHLAAKNNCPEMVSLLLLNNADTSINNHRQQLALGLTSSPQVLQLFTQHKSQIPLVIPHINKQTLLAQLQEKNNLIAEQKALLEKLEKTQIVAPTKKSLFNFFKRPRNTIELSNVTHATSCEHTHQHT